MNLFWFKKRKNQRDFNREINIAIVQEMNYFGEATAQHIKAYPELADIAHSKINPDYADTNYQQQAGFSSEVKNVTRTNAENIIAKSKIRIARTDNIGAVNHPQYDSVIVDKNGNPILDKNGQYTGGTQQKNFSNVKNYDKLLGKDYEHYKDAKIAVPPDQYDNIIKSWDDKITRDREQSQYLRSNGKDAQADAIDAQIERIQDVKSRTIASKVSTTDAMEARKYPLLSTVKDIGRVAHHAGMDAMKTGATIGGSICTMKAAYAVYKGNKTIKNASIDIVLGTGRAAASSYAMGATSSVVGGALKSTTNHVCQNLSKGNGPAAVINTGIILARNTKALICGHISLEDYTANIGREGTTLAASMTGANLGAVTGTFILPGVGTIVGGVVGGMIASVLSGAMFCELQKSIADTKLSDEQRRLIADICIKIKEQEEEYRIMVDDYLDYFLSYKETQIKESFAMIIQSIECGSSIHEGLTQLSDAFKAKLPFDSNDEFKKHINTDGVLKL